MNYEKYDLFHRFHLMPVFASAKFRLDIEICDSV